MHSGFAGRISRRERNFWFSIPTIFMTAYPDKRVRDRAMSAGAVCFLSKPFDPADLIGCIKSALGREPT